MSISIKWLAAVALICIAYPPVVAQAESFSKLTRQQHSVSKLTKGKAGLRGWIVSSGDKRFFCQIRATLAYVNKKEMVGITAAGRLVKMDRATFEASIGGHDPSIPQWSDLQAGRLKPADVGNCSPAR